MESQDNRPRKKRVQREEIGGQLLADSIIGEIDRLGAISQQAERTAGMLKGVIEQAAQTKITVDTAALEAKEKEFTAALERQVKRIRAATRTVRATLWLMIVVLFLCFAVGYCYLETHPWKVKYFHLEQLYNNLEQEMLKQAAKKPVKKATKKREQ